MAIEIEQRIDELGDLAAREHNYTKLKTFIEQFFERIGARQQQCEEAKRISRAT